jgi:hypothetical protein
VQKLVVFNCTKGNVRLITCTKGNVRLP